MYIIQFINLKVHRHMGKALTSLQQKLTYSIQRKKYNLKDLFRQPTLALLIHNARHVSCLKKMKYVKQINYQTIPLYNILQHGSLLKNEFLYIANDLNFMTKITKFSMLPSLLCKSRCICTFQPLCPVFTYFIFLNCSAKGIFVVVLHLTYSSPQSQ